MSHLNHHRRSLAVLCLLGAAALAGCGQGISVPSTAPVTGVVTYKGRPLQGIRVTLHSLEASDSTGFIPSGETGPDGKFFLSTGAPGNGAPPGTYFVTFQKPEIGSAASTGSIETEVDAFGGKYSDPAQSQWTVTVVDGENLLQPFELK
jgi:hypothetical protein